MAKTKIEWATDVWNPTVGCTKVSAGCKNCYAERMYERFNPTEKFSEVKCYPERLEQPLRWKKSRHVFVDSMSDLFHPDVPGNFIAQVFAICRIAEQHTFMILTKRAGYMVACLNDPYFWKEVTNQVEYFAENGPTVDTTPSNVWLGVSVEDQNAADERIPLLLQTPAAVRFVSVEPMLGKIDLWKYATCEETFGSIYDHRGTYPFYQALGWANTSVKTNDGIDWVIAGCESGPRARPMNYEWVAELRDDCEAADVPFFLKQMMVDGKLIKMPELDGKVWAEFPREA